MKRAIVAIILVVIALFIWRLKSPSGQQERQESPRVQAQTLKPQHTQQTPFLPMEQLLSEVNAGDRSRGVPRKSEDALRSALSTDKELALFKLLSDKALRTSEEERQYLKLISDPARILVAKRDLLSVAPSQESEMKRIIQVKFLANSYFWKDNPEGVLTHQTISDVLLYEFPADTTTEVLKSLYGDKIELYQYLLMGDPPEAAEILTRATGTPLEKVFRLAAGLIGR